MPLFQWSKGWVSLSTGMLLRFPLLLLECLDCRILQLLLLWGSLLEAVLTKSGACSKTRQISLKVGELPQIELKSKVGKVSSYATFSPSSFFWDNKMAPIYKARALYGSSLGACLKVRVTPVFVTWLYGKRDVSFADSLRLAHSVNY